MSSPLSSGPRAAAPGGGGRPGGGNRPGPGGPRLTLRRDPLRLAASPGPWVSAAYLAGYVAIGWALFAVAFTSVAVTAALCVTFAGVPLLTAAAFALRGCASVERWRLRPMFARPVRGGYRPVTRPGVFSRAGTHWRDPATWRDVAYLIGLWVPLYVLDLAVLAVWTVLLAGVSLPAWYWAIPERFTPHGPIIHGVSLGYFPHGPHGAGAAGIFVDTLPKALLCAAGFAAAFLAFNYVLVATARAHAHAARAILRAHGDPLAGARELLARPGPLPPLTPAGPALPTPGGREPPPR